MLDRESKRERILEGKIRETKLRQKAQEKQAAEQQRIKDEIANSQQVETPNGEVKENLNLKKSLSEGL